MHPAARIRAFSSYSWKRKKFSVTEAKLGVFFWGGEFESCRGKKFPFGRETLLPPVGKLVFLFPFFFFYIKTRFDSPFDLIFFFPSSQKWEVIVWWFWSLQMRLEDREQTLGFDVARRREFRCGFLFCFVSQDRGRVYNKIYPVEEWTAKMQMFNKLRQLDAYPKVNEDFYSRTLSGGVITIVSSIFMAILFITELSEASSTPPYSLLSNRFLLLLFSLSFSQKLDSLTEWQNFFVILAGSLGLFLSSRTTNQLVVDTARGETLTINVSVSTKQFYFCRGQSQFTVLNFLGFCNLGFDLWLVILFLDPISTQD